MPCEGTAKQGFDCLSLRHSATLIAFVACNARATLKRQSLNKENESGLWQQAS